MTPEEVIAAELLDVYDHVAPERYADSIVERLAANGYTIVPSVQPTDTKNYAHSDEGEDFLGWEVHDGPYFVSVYDQGEVQVSYDGNVAEPMSADYARDLGLALLAAAVSAEGDTNCPHDSESGDEGPISELGRMPVRWKCDRCGRIKTEEIQ